MLNMRKITAVAVLAADKRGAAGLTEAYLEEPVPSKLRHAPGLRRSIEQRRILGFGAQ